MKSAATWLKRLAISFTLLFLLLTCTPFEQWWMQRLESSWTDDIPPVLLVLGADQQAPGIIGYSTYVRLYYTVRYWRQGKIRTIVVTGGAADANSGPLSRDMRDFLIGHGIPADAILVEEQSKSTMENFTFSRALMDSQPGAKGFLTSDFHSGRAAGVSARLGLNWSPVPVPDAHKRWNSWVQRWPIAWDLALETVKRVWYKAHSWI